MNVLEAIESRRSVRKYKPKAIPDGDLKKILTAAQLAPAQATSIRGASSSPGIQR